MGYGVLDFRRRRASGFGGFSPASLFASGEEGAWYDPSDLSTLFQDSLGTTPVTTADDPVGLMLDKRKGLVLGPELVTNGGFESSLTGWNDISSGDGTVAQADNSAVLTSGSGARGQITQSLSTVVGKSYRLRFNITQADAGSSLFEVGTASGANNTLLIQSLSVGSYSYLFTAESSATFISPASAFGVDVTKISNISVRELPGNHATQATSAARPTYQYGWDGVGPLGPELVTNGGFATDSDWVEGTYFSISGGVASKTSGSSTLTQTISIVEGDVYQINFGWASVAGTLSIELGGTSLPNVSSSGAFSYIAQAGASGEIRFSGGGSTAGDLDNVSVKKLPVESRLHWLAFDGVDDYMVTGAITPGVDKSQVFVGLLKTSSATDIVMETSVNAGGTSNPGAFYVVAGEDAAARYSTLAGGDGGAASASRIAKITTASSYPEKTVLTATSDIAGDLVRMAKNGVYGTDTTADMGTGNFLAYPLNIGSRNQASLFLEGNIYGIILRFGANLTSAQIASTETYLATRTGVTL